MFFPRLRRRAKWAFAFLAFAFALTFVVAGVGTGVGSGIGDYLAEIFNRQATGGASVGDARDRVQDNPKDAQAQLDLANALQASGETDEAIVALEAYTKLRPNDADALQQLAGLYLIEAGEAQQRAEAAQLDLARTSFGDELQDPNGKLAQGLGSDPLTSALRDEANRRYSEAYTATQSAYAREAAVWEKVAKLVPDDPAVFRELGRSSTGAGDYQRAIEAYRSYLRLAPDAADAAQVRALISQLRVQASGLTSTG